MADYMRVIMIVVMSVLFVIFLGIGITHFRKINQMSADADMESRRTSGEIMEWFSSNYTAEEIDHVSGADSGAFHGAALLYPFRQNCRTSSC